MLKFLPLSSREHMSTPTKAVIRKRQKERIEAMGRTIGRCLLDIEEHLGSCLYWPSRFTEAMLTTHLRFPDRWQLTLFLLANRCPPKLMIEWYMSRGMLKDKSARMQVADLLHKHMNGTLEKQGYTTWIMQATSTKPVWERKHKWDGVGDPVQDKVQVISTPSFAEDYQHQHHWDEAIDMLKLPEQVTPVRYAQGAWG
jgi:hypothetical protein